MSDLLPVILTSKDFVLLESLLPISGEVFPGAANIIRHKLSRATLVFPHDIPSDVVTLNSRVRYRVAGNHCEERVLVAGPSEEIFGLTLLLVSQRGLALVGARAGQTVEAGRRDGSIEQINIEAVSYQPEQRRERPILQVVARNGGLTASTTRPVRPAPPAVPFEGGDDPGPAAA